MEFSAPADGEPGPLVLKHPPLASHLLHQSLLRTAMSRFFSRLLIVPAVTGFFLLPYRGNAQVKHESSEQSSKEERAIFQSSLISDLDQDLDSGMREARKQIIDRIQEICQDESSINLEQVISKSLEQNVLLPESSRNSLKSIFLRQFSSDEEIPTSQELDNLLNNESTRQRVASGAVAALGAATQIPFHKFPLGIGKKLHLVTISALIVSLYLYIINRDLHPFPEPKPNGNGNDNDNGSKTFVIPCLEINFALFED